MRDVIFWHNENLLHINYKPKNQCLLCGNAGAATSAHQVCGTLLAEGAALF